jgi:hypothetical protein
MSCLWRTSKNEAHKGGGTIRDTMLLEDAQKYYNEKHSQSLQLLATKLAFGGHPKIGK